MVNLLLGHLKYFIGVDDVINSFLKMHSNAVYLMKSEFSYQNWWSI